MCSPLTAQDELCALLELETPWSVAALVPIGVPDETPEPRPRKPFDEVCTIIE
jgi:nitroreductase